MSKNAAQRLLRAWRLYLLTVVEATSCKPQNHGNSLSKIDFRHQIYKLTSPNLTSEIWHPWMVHRFPTSPLSPRGLRGVSAQSPRSHPPQIEPGDLAGAPWSETLAEKLQEGSADVGRYSPGTHGPFKGVQPDWPGSPKYEKLVFPYWSASKRAVSQTGGPLPTQSLHGAYTEPTRISGVQTWNCQSD